MARERLFISHIAAVQQPKIRASIAATISWFSFRGEGSLINHVFAVINYRHFSFHSVIVFCSGGAFIQEVVIGNIFH
jgi:hypothetical protein